MPSSAFSDHLLGNADFLNHFAQGLTKNREMAKDLYQETICRALMNSEKFREGSNLRAWTATIMRNVFINDYRRSRRQVYVVSTAQELLLEYRQLTAGNEGESCLRIKQIQQAIQNLPLILRQPFLLYCEGYLYREIAIMLLEPVGTIKSRIHLARRMLRPQVGRH